jgi:hypothetical protein
LLLCGVERESRWRARISSSRRCFANALGGAIIVGTSKDDELKLEERDGGIARTKKDWHPLAEVFTVYLRADDQWRVKVRC